MSSELDIVTLTEARSFLNFESSFTDDDLELQEFISRVTDVIEAEVGPVVPRAQTSVIYGTSGNTVPAPTWPIASLTFGEFLADASAVDISKMIADRGVITTYDGSTLPLTPWRLTYQAGRAVTPDSIKAGTLAVLKSAWSSQRGNRGADAPVFSCYVAEPWLKQHRLSIGFA